MNRRSFVKHSGLIAGATLIQHSSLFASYTDFPVVRVAADKRNFTSPAIEKAIEQFALKSKNKELLWLFNNCFPNTLDTTVFFEEKDGKPDTYVITGDIDAMWMRDSSAQVWPYLQFAKEDAAIHKLIAGVIHRQTHYILEDPYANAFYKDDAKKSEWESDHTKMKPGIHERKWEIDSLCYPIRLAYHFWKETNDVTPFNDDWKKAATTILATFKDQQKKDSDGAYSFQRTTANATDTQPMSGYGYPVKPVGLISSAFRPSDDATLFSFLIPSNFFAVTSLRQAAEMMTSVYKDDATAKELINLADEVEKALKQYAIVDHPQHGKIYAYEVNGFGGVNLMDDANVPSLLGLPYLGCVDASDKIYQNTRKFVWSKSNPFFFKGSAGEGIGGPHVGKDMIWPMGITMHALTSNSDDEIKQALNMLRQSHAGTGFMHESFNKNDAANFTRKWFAWANTLFGELLLKTMKERPHLLV